MSLQLNARGALLDQFVNRPRGVSDPVHDELRRILKQVVGTLPPFGGQFIARDGKLDCA